MIITLKGCTATAFISGLDFFSVSSGTVSGATVTISQQTISKDAATSTSARQIATVALNSGYETLVVTVTMGGSSVNNWYKNGKVTIPANTTVTGDIKISASATAVSGGGDGNIYTYSSIPTQYIKEQYLVLGATVQAGSEFFTIENIPVTPGYLYSSTKVRNIIYKTSDGTPVLTSGFGGADCTMSFGKNISTFTACYKYADIQPSDVNLIAVGPEEFGTCDTKTVDGMTVTMYGNATSAKIAPYYSPNSDYNYFTIVYDNVQPNVIYSAPFARNVTVVGAEVQTLAFGGSQTATITTADDTTKIAITYKRQDLNPSEALITIQN